MDAIEFGNYIKLIRDNVLSRPAMAKKSGLHVNTIKGYEMEGRLADIDYLAALAVETGHCFADLINKRLMAGKLGGVAEEQHLLVSDIRADYKVTKKSQTLAIPVYGSNSKLHIDNRLLPNGIEHAALALFDARQLVEFNSQVLMFNTAEKTIQDGQLYIVDIGNGAVVRQVQNGLGGAIILSSDKSGITPLTVPREQIDHITVLGRVVCLLSYT
ncbi:S24 family peptidase [Rheinheimera gaetbuli]